MTFPLKETLAMTRAREANRANGRRLSDSLETLTRDQQRQLSRIEQDGRAAQSFLQRIKSSTGLSKRRVRPEPNESRLFEEMIKPQPRMKFDRRCRDSACLAASAADANGENSASNCLPRSPACPSYKQNPVPVRKVHAWTSATARTLSRKKQPQVARPLGRRRHSVASSDDSDDDDDFLNWSKKKPVQNGRRASVGGHVPVTRKSSLPIITESTGGRNI